MKSEIKNNVMKKLQKKIPKKFLYWLKTGRNIYLSPTEEAFIRINKNRIFKPFKFIIFLRDFWISGNKILCPLCGRNFKKMLPMGRRKSVKCPTCSSLERHRLIVLFLLKKTDFFINNQKILHISPTSGFMNLLERKSNLEYISIDLTSSRTTLRMDLTDLKFNDNLFDVCICSHVLEHVKDDIKVMKEIYRVLKLKGYAIIQTPINYSIEKTVEHKNNAKLEDDLLGIHHHRTYGRDYKKRLESVGFQVREERFGQELGERLSKKFVVDRSERIYMCIKLN